MYIRATSSTITAIAAAIGRLRGRGLTCAYTYEIYQEFYNKPYFVDHVHVHHSLNAAFGRLLYRNRLALSIKFITEHQNYAFINSINIGVGPTTMAEWII